jgi:hypothetical protein
VPWPMKSGPTTARISSVPNLIVCTPGIVEVLSVDTCPGDQLGNCK